VMLIVGGSGSNLGGVIGSILVWGIWAGSGTLTSALFPPEQQARAASLQIVAFGVMLCIILLVRPTGLFGERPRRARLGKRAKVAAGESGS
ncbi:branched-chain amino acid ABC transporter permease, partial [Mesorhizobium sp. B1-1-5]